METRIDKMSEILENKVKVDGKSKFGIMPQWVYVYKRGIFGCYRKRLLGIVKDDSLIAIARIKGTDSINWSKKVNCIAVFEIIHEHSTEAETAVNRHIR